MKKEEECATICEFRCVSHYSLTFDDPESGSAHPSQSKKERNHAAPEPLRINNFAPDICR